MKLYKLIIILVAALLMLAGCGRFNAVSPEGFAEVKRQGIGNFFAISPEGVKFGVRTEKNYPKQSLDYWETALEDYMKDAGYTYISGPEKFETRKREGVYFEWGVPYQGKDFVYLTGYVVSGRKLVIIEAGGEYETYNQYKPEIIDALENMNVR